MTKSISGEGSIRKRMSGKLAGKWRVQWGYEDPISRDHVQVDRTFPAQGEGAAFLKDLKARVHTGQKIEEANTKKTLTLRCWFDDLAGTKANGFEGKWVEDGMQTTTVSYRRGRFDKYVKGSDIADMPMKHLDGDRARAFFRSLPSDIGQATRLELKRDLVKVFNDAIDTYERLPNMRNPFSKVKVEVPEPREAIALAPERAVRSIKRLVTPEDRAFLGLFLLSGVRLSEHMAICKEQIDFKRGTILIDRAVKFGSTGRQTMGLPKGNKPRVVVMCPTLAALLQPLMGGSSEFLFPAAVEDKPRMKKLFYATWRRVVKEAKLPEEIAPQDCRLTHNNWIEKLMPSVSTSTRLEHLGHSTARRDAENKGIAVNLRNYTRFLSEAHDILRAEVERVVGFTVMPGEAIEEELVEAA